MWYKFLCIPFPSKSKTKTKNQDPSIHIVFFFSPKISFFPFLFPQDEQPQEDDDEELEAVARPVDSDEGDNPPAAAFFELVDDEVDETTCETKRESNEDHRGLYGRRMAESFSSLQIHFVLLISRQGKVRLTKWYSPYSPKERSKLIQELSGMILTRGPKLCNFVEWKGFKVVYKSCCGCGKKGDMAKKSYLEWVQDFRNLTGIPITSHIISLIVGSEEQALKQAGTC